MNSEAFRELVWQKGRELYRDMPWRQTDDPYKIMVSELMLQQTQVDRVVPKYEEFILRYPDVLTLATAPLADIISLWNGLGYNRRAKFLHDSAVKILTDFNGKVPESYEGLLSLPGIGPNTAGAILAYGFDQPAGFIETNIRTVYFQHFFEDSHLITDDELRQVVRDTVDTEHPREWFWALMDYGSYLKRQGSGQLDKSAHYKKQAPLKGSVREVRGQIIRALTKDSMSEDELREDVTGDERFNGALDALLKEGLVSLTDRKLHLTK
jgi:A/G-specific adenine glycosylase